MFTYQQKEGLIQVMRVNEKSGDADSFCSFTAASAMDFEYA
jgi:hypothetical protein